MISSDRHRQVMVLFDEICDLPAEDRDALLSARCANDPELRQEVESMLRHDRTELSLFESGESKNAEILEAAWAATAHRAGELPTEIGGYRIIREVGQGGMGIIYEAQQDSPKRMVALKVLKSSSFSRDMLKRFEHEAYVLGQLQHPGIANIHEAGISDSLQGRRPFFAMEFIDGEPLDQHSDNHHLGTNQRLELLARVCDAVQYAHQKGVIHRDLKPSNILVVEQEVDASRHSHRTSSSSLAVDLIGQPKVLDFGIARVTDSDIQTVTVQAEVGQLIGTLGYMSPEQVAGATADLDTRCDIYALGVMLYHLVAGRRPYDLKDKSVAEAARIIREDDPPLLGTFDRSLRGDVETIVAKAMEKDRERRYQSAAELATDIRRYLTDQPIEARPASTYYQVSKFSKRNKGLVAGLAATLVMLVVALIGTSYGLWQASTQRDKALFAQAEAESSNQRLKKVVDFQASMLTDIDVQAIGREWTSRQRAKIIKALEKANGGTATTVELSTLDDLLRKANSTDLAREVLDVSLLAQSVAAVDRDFSDDPTVAAALRFSLAQVYSALGLLDAASEQFEFAHKLRSESLGKNDPETLNSLAALGNLKIRQNQYEEAIQITNQVLLNRQHILGENHPETIASMVSTGSALRRAGKYDKAEPLLRDAVDRTTTHLGVDHPQTSSASAEMGQLLKSLGKYEEAEPFFRKTLSARQHNLGSEHPKTLLAMNSLGLLLQLRGKLDEAEACYRSAWEGRKRTLGAEHISTLNSIHNMGAVAKLRGDLVSARIYLEQALEGKKRVFELGHPSVASALGQLTGLCYKEGNLAEAERHARESYTIYNNWYGAEHTRTLQAQNNIARLQLDRGEYGGAEETLRAALAICRQRFADEHQLTDRVTSNLVDALQAQNRHEEAEPLCQQLVAARRKRLPEKHEAIGRALFMLATSQVENSNIPLATETLDECEDVQGNHYPPEHWLFSAIKSMRGIIAVRQGDYAVGEEMLLASYDALNAGFERIPIAFRALQYGLARKRIISLYEAWGRPDDAQEWRQTFANDPGD